MTEQHEIYRVTAHDIGQLLNQLNFILAQITDRLDKMEGLRDNPAFYSSEFTYPGQTLSGFLKASAASADYSGLTLSDLNTTTTIIQDGLFQILDSNGEVIHQLGDE